MKISLKVLSADVNEHVHSLETSKLFDDCERKILKIVRIQEREMEAGWIKMFGNFSDSFSGITLVLSCRATGTIKASRGSLTPIRVCVGDMNSEKRAPP